MILEEILKEVQKLKKQGKPFLIAIDGRSGSGKSTFADKLKELLTRSEIIHLDDFNLYESNKDKVVNEILEPAKTTLEDKILIIEGIFSLSNEFNSYYNYRIWIDCPTEVGFKRGLERDSALNEVDNSQKWQDYYLPKEEIYIKTESPQHKADVTINSELPF